jgi:hypothetical protein
VNSSASAGTIEWYWNRLRCMSPAEVAYRVQQKFNTTAQQLGLATAREVPAADFTRPASAFIAPVATLAPAAYVAAADRLLAGVLRVFDIEYRYTDTPAWNADPKTGRVAPLDFGKALDYRNEARVGDIKYLWEPNRHLHLVTIAQAYRLTGDARYLTGLQRLLDSWIDQCPYLRGPNWTSSLELGIRLINWSLAWQLIGGADSPLFRSESGRTFRDRWSRAVFQHMHFIAGHFSRFSSANNHLIGEAAGLYVGATTWPLWPQAARWRRQARAELLREAHKQHTPDGVNREQAISYQQFVLDFLLLAGLAGRHNADEFPSGYWARLEKMCEFLGGVMDVRGNVPMIGDADDGYAVTLAPTADFCPYRSLLATAAVLFARPAFKAKARQFDDKSHWLLGDVGAGAFAALDSTPAALPRAFPQGGYYVLGVDLDKPSEVRVVVDAGPLGYQRIAAHGHADALAFTLSIGGVEFLIDPGTYVYHTQRDWRDYFRSTAAHNTVRIDGQDQSVIGGSFMWLQHAHARCIAWEPGMTHDRFTGWHDGYRRLLDPLRHERELVFDKAARVLRVTDSMECRARHTVEQCWHFAEDVDVTVAGDGAVVAQAAGQQVRLATRGTHPVTVEMYRGQTSPKRGWVSRRFGHKQVATTVVWRSEINGTSRMETAIECSRGGATR